MSRLAVVIPEMGTGGAEVVAATLTLHHLQGGGEVTVFSAGGWRMPALVEAGARWVDVPLQGRSPVDLARSAWRMRRARIREHDLVHAHNVKAAVAARTALGTGTGRPRVLVSAHGFLAPDRSRAARLLARAADHVVAVSDETADRLVEGGCPRERVTVVENAVDAPPHHDRPAARSRLGLGPDEPVALIMARMTTQKRHDLVLRAWHGWPDAPVLLVAGDGPTRPEVERLVAELGLGERVRMLGNRTDPDWLLAATDVLLLPSDMEGLPISVLEAMWLRVPVVSSAVGGMLQLSDAAGLVPQGESDGFRVQVQALLDGDPVWQERLATGAELVTDRFATARMLAAYDELYVTSGTSIGSRS